MKTFLFCFWFVCGVVGALIGLIWDAPVWGGLIGAAVAMTSTMVIGIWIVILAITNIPRNRWRL